MSIDPFVSAFVSAIIHNVFLLLIVCLILMRVILSGHYQFNFHTQLMEGYCIENVSPVTFMHRANGRRLKRKIKSTKINLSLNLENLCNENVCIMLKNEIVWKEHQIECIDHLKYYRLNVSISSKINSEKEVLNTIRHFFRCMLLAPIFV